MGIAIIAGCRTPFTKIGTTLKNFSAIDLGVLTVNSLVDNFQLSSDPNGLLVFGTVIGHSDVSNIAREIALESKIHPQTRAFSTVMACATSLNTIAEAAHWIARGATPWAIAGGSESMSNFPVGYSKKIERTLRDLKFSKSKKNKLESILQIRPKDLLPQIPQVAERLTGLSMGEHCEQMVKEWKIPRQDQDLLAVKSHQNAAKAKDWHQKQILKGFSDNLVRENTTLEKISQLKPAFVKDGTLTAANSSPLTDGSAAVLLADEKYAKNKGWPILALIDDFEMAAVDMRTEGLLMAPPYALYRLLQRSGKKFDSFDRFEIHEAFAAQVLCNLKALADTSWCQKNLGGPALLSSSSKFINEQSTGVNCSIDDRLNTKGGSIALGHPFAATGARLLMGLAEQMHEDKLQSGLISICAAGGLGFVATLVKKSN